MKRICASSVFSILYQARYSGKTQEDFFLAICDSVGLKYGSFKYDDSTPGKIKSGAIGFNEDITNAMRSSSKETIYKGVLESLIPLISPSKQIQTVRALRAIIREDETIIPGVIVGLDPAYERNNLLQKKKITYHEFIANILFYAITQVKSGECKAAAKEVPAKGYLDEFQVGETIVLQSAGDVSELADFQPLLSTAKSDDFGTTFYKICEGTIPSVSNTTAVMFFATEIRNSAIRFTDMKSYMENHIGDYILSRAKITELTNKGKLSVVSWEGIKKLISRNKKSGVWSEDTLGAFLNFIFLDQELHAPKIFSKIEFSGEGSRSDGVYLFSVDGETHVIHQLVFGASNIVGNLEDAIDNAFTRVSEIHENEENELQTVENTLYANYFDLPTTEYIKKLIVPQESDIEKPEVAYGLFLGYSLGLSNKGLSSDQFKKAAVKKLNSDIEAIKPYLYRKIVENHLEGYSFYVYILPFNNAETERVSVLKETFDFEARAER